MNAISFDQAAPIPVDPRVLEGAAVVDAGKVDDFLEVSPPIVEERRRARPRVW